jgi:hypothetical protein
MGIAFIAILIEFVCNWSSMGMTSAMNKKSKKAGLKFKALFIELVDVLMSETTNKGHK